jgi:hypothetical protein
MLSSNRTAPLLRGSSAEKAFGVLRDEGLVVTVPGRGIYVIDR